MPEVLRASLDHVSLASVLQLVAAEAHCGQVRVGDEAPSADEADRALILVANGNIVDARLGTHEGRTALFESFLLERGPIVVDAGDEVPPGSPLGDTASLILVGYRLVDDWERVRPLHLAVVGDPTEPSIGPLLPFLPSGSVESAVQRAGLARISAVDPLLAGLESGWLEETEAPAVTQLPEGWTELGVDDLLDRARDHHRAGEFDAAEAALTQALALEPGHRIAAQNLARIRTLRSRLPDRAA